MKIGDQIIAIWVIQHHQLKINDAGKVTKIGKTNFIVKFDSRMQNFQFNNEDNFAVKYKIYNRNKNLKSLLDIL